MVTEPVTRNEREYRDGWAAFHAGRSLTSNPHASVEKCHAGRRITNYDSWRDGWTDALDTAARQGER